MTKVSQQGFGAAQVSCRRIKGNMSEFREAPELMRTRLWLTRPGFGRDPVLTPEETCGRIAVLSASLLTITAISCASLGLWRVGTDIQWTSAFVIREGFLSHWQVWIGAAVATQYTSWWLARYAGMLRRQEAETAPAA
jgi:hypothetical protein